MEKKDQDCAEVLKKLEPCDSRGTLKPQSKPPQLELQEHAPFDSMPLPLQIDALGPLRGGGGEVARHVALIE